MDGSDDPSPGGQSQPRIASNVLGNDRLELRRMMSDLQDLFSGGQSQSQIASSVLENDQPEL